MTITKQKLKDQVKTIIDNLENGLEVEEGVHYIAEYDEGDIISGIDYLIDALDIEYIVTGDGDYLGASVLVAFGGPNIWVNTRNKTVEAYWLGESLTKSYFNDAMDIDGTLQDLWESQ